jgi:hypothetical protein
MDLEEHPYSMGRLGGERVDSKIIGRGVGSSAAVVARPDIVTVTPLSRLEVVEAPNGGTNDVISRQFIEPGHQVGHSLIVAGKQDAVIPDRRVVPDDVVIGAPENVSVTTQLDAYGGR